MSDLQGAQHAGLRDLLNGFAQRHVNGDQHRAQLVIGQHHAHGHLLHRHAQVRRCFSLKQLGVAWKAAEWLACGSQRLLV